MENADNGGIVWSDRKRIAFGLPWTFTKYTLTKEKLLIHTGMLNTQEDEVRLYRIMDVTLRRSLWNRAMPWLSVAFRLLWMSSTNSRFHPVVTAHRHIVR